MSGASECYLPRGEYQLGWMESMGASGRRSSAKKAFEQLKQKFSRGINFDECHKNISLIYLKESALLLHQQAR